MTSTQAVAAVRRLFDAQKAGHAGTLDPLATGMLPIALGEATKTVPFAVDGEKAYRFTVRWGAETDTDDAEGAGRAHVRACGPSREADRGAAAALHRRDQPGAAAFSAIKVDGDRAYDLARSGETVVLEPRLDRRSIGSRSSTCRTPTRRASRPSAARAPTCARSPATWAARSAALGHVIGLRRTRVGAFDEAAAVTLADLEEAAERPATRRALAASGRGRARRLPGAQRRTRTMPPACARPGGAGARARRAGRQRCGVCALQRPHSRLGRAGKGRLPADARVQFRLSAAHLHKARTIG